MIEIFETNYFDCENDEQYLELRFTCFHDIKMFEFLLTKPYFKLYKEYLQKRIFADRYYDLYKYYIPEELVTKSTYAYASIKYSDLLEYNITNTNEFISFISNEFRLYKIKNILI